MLAEGAPTKPNILEQGCKSFRAAGRKKKRNIAVGAGETSKDNRHPLNALEREQKSTASEDNQPVSRRRSKTERKTKIGKRGGGAGAIVQNP